MYKDYELWVIKSNSTADLPAGTLGDDYRDIQFGVILYKNLDKRFSASGRLAENERLEGSEIASSILCFSTDVDMDTTQYLKLQFLTTMDHKTIPQCAQLNIEDNYNILWSKNSCRTDVDAGGKILCRCNHLSNFAVLQTPRPVKIEPNHKASMIIALFGCIVSITCLLITLLRIRDLKSFLHFCLCLSLLLAYTLNVGGLYRTDHETGCMWITAFVHFFLLLAFSIMLAEGLELYLRVNVVFNLESWDWTMFCPVFLIPTFIVGGTVAFTWKNGYRSPEFCSLNMESGSLWSFLLSVIFVVLANAILCTLSLITMLSPNAMINQAKREHDDKTNLISIAIITLLNALTWGFGVLVLHGQDITFHYLFAISTTLQSFVIFVFYCILFEQVPSQDRFGEQLFAYQEEMSTSSDTYSTIRTTITRFSKKYGGLLLAPKSTTV